jgi:hypothetical protein
LFSYPRCESTTSVANLVDFADQPWSFGNL